MYHDLPDVLSKLLLNKNKMIIDTTYKANADFMNHYSNTY